MEEKLTLPQVIELTRDRLGDIDVPVKYKHISDGIYQAINNLNAILEALARDKKEEETPETEE
jgi:hypothetical protein